MISLFLLLFLAFVCSSSLRYEHTIAWQVTPLQKKTTTPSLSFFFFPCQIQESLELVAQTRSLKWGNLQVCFYLPPPPFFYFHTSTFQLLDGPWPQVPSLLPPGFCLQFLSRIGFSNPTARRFFIECCQLRYIILFDVRAKYECAGA